MKNLSLIFLLVLSSCVVRSKADNLIRDMWNHDCTSLSRRSLVDHLVHHPPTYMSFMDLTKLLGEPLHKRYFSDGNFLYVYLIESPEYGEECAYGDLYVACFGKDKKMKSGYIRFIGDSIKETKFWFSRSVPSTSIEGDTSKSEFILRLVHPARSYFD